jgi:hypothetical protein
MRLMFALRTNFNKINFLIFVELLTDIMFKYQYNYSCKNDMKYFLLNLKNVSGT